MLTKNAYALVFGLMSKAHYVTMTSIKNETSNRVDVSSNSYAGAYGSYDAFCQFKENTFDSNGVPVNQGLYFGTGDTTPSVNDYTLSGEFIQNLRSDDVISSTASGAGYTELQATIAIKNNNASSVTIKEIGLFGRLYRSDDGSNIFLMDRIVLATPITLAAGETKSITYNLRHTY